MKTKPIALLTAGVMLTASATIMPVNAAEPSANTKVTDKLPEWVPTDFESALEFRNIYGATHIDDGLICAVFWEQAEKVPEGEPQGVLRYDLRTTKGMTQCLKQDIYASKDKAFNYEVVVYKPITQGELEITFTDTWVNANGEKKYTFSIDGLMNAVETDIYSWLPDCYEEYRVYKLTYNDVSVKDNYVVFCFDSNAGTAFDWYHTPSNDYDRSVIDYVKTEYCNEETSELIDGGEQHRIELYQAKKDGMAKLSYDYVANYGKPYLPEEVDKTLVADCAIIDNAQNILLPGNMKVTVVDYDTGKPLTIDENSMLAIWTDISYNTPKGEMSTGPIYELKPNPTIIDDLWNFSKADHFAFRLGDYDIPEGYTAPDNKGFIVYSKGSILPDYMTVTEYENGSADVVFRLKKESRRVPPEEKSADLTDLKKGETRITVYDKDTGELIPSDLLEHHYCGFGTDIRFEEPNVPGGWMMTGPIYVVKTNPQVYQTDLANLYRSADIFEFLCDDQPEVTLYDNGAMDLVIRTKITVSGNINGDSEFNIADLVALQKWLLNAYDEELYSWSEADFDLDNKLTIFDLVLMRKELIKKNTKTYVEPDKRTTNGSPLLVLVDGLKLYLGPGESYKSVASIPEGTKLYELGYQNDNDVWLFTEYKGQYGWVKTVDGENKTMTLYFEKYVDKPVIYLYPEEETDVHVELELTESELSTTYPKYDNGWDVVASPDGSLLNKADNTHHKYLFWDSANCRTRFDMSKGFCVAGSDTESFLKEKLTYMGLNEEEMNEFIVYWLPRMEHNKYNLISFQGDVYTNSAKLDITPNPDSMLRIFMAYVPLEYKVEIEPQLLETFERNGFTVVEWGGSEIKS